MPLDPLDEFLPPRYRSAGRRPEANNDRTAAANAPLSALRGWAAGTAGLPGDIEGLARAGISQLPPQLLTAFPALRAFGIGSRADPTPQMPTTEFYNEYLPGAQLNQTPTGKAFTTSGNLFGGTGTTTLAKYGIKSAKATGQALGPTAVRIGEDYLQRQGLMPGVIKPKGGNQLAGSFENSLKGLKTDVPAFDFSEGRNMKQTDANFIEQNFPGITQEYSDAFRASGMHSMDYAKKQIPWLKQNHPEIIDSLLTGKTKDQALNTWIDKQLTNYIKNDMATPGDPIRALAERGITYAEMAPLNTYLSDVLGRRRESVGFPAKGFGQSEAAQRWEAAADEAIHNAPARERLNTTISASEKNLLENPWLAKVPPETMTYGAYANSGQQLAFDHIVDELRNATDLASSLPPNLRLKSSSLPQLSVPQAVERVSQINAWRAAEAIKAEKAGMMGNLNANSRLEDPTTQLSFVDKPGMKWVDIPETTDKIGLNLCTTIGKQGGWCTQGEGLAKSYGSGPNRLTTLIDADGRPHAQAKITSIPYSGDIMDDVDEIRQTMSAAEDRKFQKYINSDEFFRYGNIDTEEVLAWLQSNMPKSYKRYLASISGPSNITEIKPVSNDFSSARALEYKSRDPQYQNKITDSTLKFLNSSEWGTVTDLDHFNIVDLKDTHSVQRALREVLDRDLPKDRIDKFNYAVNFNPEANRFMSTRQFSDFLEPPEGFAKGGLVHMGIGGLLKLKNAVKGAQKVLPAAMEAGKVLPRAEADANKAKFMVESQDPRVMYHGTQADIKKFIPSKGAVFVSPDPKFASKHARQSLIIEDMDDIDNIMQTMSAAEQRKFNKYISSDEFNAEEVSTWLQSNMPKSYANSNVMPLRVQIKNPFDYENPSHIEELKNLARKQFPEDVQVMSYIDQMKNYDHNWPFVENADIQRLIQQAGHDSFYSSEKGTKNLGIYDPKRIKSDISNRGTYDITDLDISKAKGGAVHMDEGGAAFGVFPQMKPRRALQDREAAANAPLSALRGYAAGTAGLPGDIEGLARAGISQLPPQLLTAFPALRAFGIGSRADPTPQLPTTEFYNEYLPGAQLNATPTGKAFTTAGNLFGGAGSTTLARYGIKSAKATAKAIAEAAPGPASGSRAAQLGVIKMPGGNWLSGSVEESVKPLKRRQTPSLATSQEEADDLIARGFVRAKSGVDGMYLPPDPINTFIDKKIAPYIRDEMATPNDPLRAMAEKYAVDKPVKLAEVQGRIDAFAAKMEQTARKRGVPVEQLTSMRQQMIGLEKERDLLQVREALHAEILPTTYDMGRKRKERGFPEEGMGVSPQAKAWESKSDSFINSLKASDLTTGDYQGVQIKNPWLFKVPPETPVYNLYNGLNSDLGFDHLVDELRNATNPASGLPKNLLIDPADLGKLTMPQAVARVADINAWRATQKIEANQLLANNAATFLHKEYPGQGMKWVELRAPKDAKKETKAALTDSDKDDIRAEAEEEAWALKDDGDTREIEDIYNDVYARIEADFSPSYQYDSVKELEDALKYEGDTMQHCVGGYCPDVVEGKSRIYSLRDDKGQPRVTIEVEPTNHLDFNKWWDQQTPQKKLEIDQRAGRGGLQAKLKARIESPEYLADMADLPPRITQIKGFKNKKPADEYLPFVQDFVKSGDWSDVSDLKNAGLHDARAAGKPIEGRPAFMTDEELAAFKAEFAPKPEGMAHGGLVSTNFDPIKIQQIIAGLDDEYDAERIQQIVAQRESAYA